MSSGQIGSFLAADPPKATGLEIILATRTIVSFIAVAEEETSNQSRIAWRVGPRASKNTRNLSLMRSERIVSDFRPDPLSYRRTMSEWHSPAPVGLTAK